MLLFLLIYSNSFGTMCDVCIITPLKLLNLFSGKKKNLFFLTGILFPTFQHCIACYAMLECN